MLQSATWMLEPVEFAPPLSGSRTCDKLHTRRRERAAPPGRPLRQRHTEGPPTTFRTWTRHRNVATLYMRRRAPPDPRLVRSVGRQCPEYSAPRTPLPSTRVAPLACISWLAEPKRQSLRSGPSEARE